MMYRPEAGQEARPRDLGISGAADFDGRFQGDVSARQALQYSLNLPAVAVLDRLGPARFTAALAAAGVRLHLPEPTADPGLAVALGGAGITLADLVRLYAALSNGGEVTPLRYQRDDPSAKGTPIFGPLGAWYVNDILAQAPPPPGALPAETRRGRRLAFKTGTSYGFRDFWAVGYDPEVTIGVWAGRPDGTPMPGRSGRLTAAPIPFNIPALPRPAMPRSQAPPPGAMLAARNHRPAALQRLVPGPLQRPAATEGGPKIGYPPDRALIEL